MICSLMLAATLAADYRLLKRAPDGAEVHLIASSARTAMVLVTFDVPTREDRTLTTRALQTLLYGNRAWPPDWRATLAANRATVGGVTVADGAQVWLECPADSLPRLAPGFLSAVLRAKLAPAPVVEDPAGPWADPPAPSVAEALLEALRPKLFPEEGPASSAKWLPESVVEHGEKYFVPANATITIAGGGNTGPVEAAVKAYRGGAKAKHTVRPPAADVRLRPRSPLAFHVIGSLFPTLSDADKAALATYRELAADALLFGLRERGMAYTLEVRLLLRPSLSALLTLIPAFDEPGSEIEALVADLLRPILHGDSSEEALARARERTAAALTDLPEDPAALLRALRQGAVEPAWFSGDFIERVRALTASDFNARVGALLVNDRRRFYVRFGPEKSERSP